MYLQDMTHEDLIELIMKLRKKIDAFEEQASIESWKSNPDRMGGQFTAEEIDRARRGGDWM